MCMADKSLEFKKKSDYNYHPATVMFDLLW